MSKLCVRCNKQINDNAMYCKYCGADQSETVRTFIPEQDYPARPDRFTRPDVPVVPASMIDDDEYDIVDENAVVISRPIAILLGIVLAAAVIIVSYNLVKFIIDKNDSHKEGPVVVVDDNNGGDSGNTGGSSSSGSDSGGGSEPAANGNSGSNNSNPGGTTGNDPGNTPGNNSGSNSGGSAGGTTPAAGSFDAYSADFVIPGSESRYITQSDYMHLDEDQIQWAINEIYARRGRIFEDPDYSKYFNKCEWYVPKYTPEEFKKIEPTIFNSYEKENLKVLIQRRKELQD